jgi:predicted AlkP superfamily phosphohydrolase/phosphomutase
MKTVIIGLDGATFDIIKPLASAGRLPVLSRLINEGASAPLRSTILPNSFPGWASCTTGTSEGMHGVFSPFIKNPGHYTVRAMSGRDIMTRPVWDILTAHGGRSIVLNVPTTYPPEPINGLMVTGMLTPGLGSEFTFPASLKSELLAELPDYIIEPERIPDKHARANEFRRSIEMREAALRSLLGRGEWDFLMVVFSVLDRAQHDYWADMDPAHPRHDPKTPREFREFIHEIYERLDAAVGRLLEQLPAESRVFVVSDHGFCSELFEVRVNELLAAAGLLAFKSPGSRKSLARVRELKG